MPNRLINIEGVRFGRLIVKEHHKNGTYKGMWECVCDCGKVVHLRSGGLRSGNTKSCGCFHQENAETCRLIDLTNRRFGGLLAVKRDGRRRGRVAWLCLCDCGRSVKVATSDLTSGNTVTCGCRCISHGHPGCYIYSAYKSRARKSKTEFAIPQELFLSLIQLNCHYCGLPPSRTLSQKKDNKDPAYFLFRWNGLDRVDNTRGYLLDNVVPCCADCNLAKKAVSAKYFLDWAQRLCCYQGWSLMQNSLSVGV